MRILALLVVMFLIACVPAVEVPEAQVVQDVPETVVEDPLPAEEAPPEEPVVVPEQVLETPSEDLNATDEAAAVPELSVAEKYLAKADALTFYYTVYDSEVFDMEVIIWKLDDVTKYATQEFYWEVDNRTHDLKKSKYFLGSEFTFTNMRNEAKDGNISIVEYVWWNRTSGSMSACLIGEGNYRYTRANCIDNLNRTKKVIHENITFKDRPKMPEEWLRPFVGKEPSEIRAARRYKEDAGFEYTVDQVYYPNPDGTVTLLYIHTGYGMPLKIEILKDKRPIKTYTYLRFSANPSSIKTWQPDFLVQ